MKIEEKKKIVENLHNKFSSSKVVIVTDYKGLDVATLNDLRCRLRESDIEYQVAKNTLFVKASEETDVALIKDNFKGPSAVALSYDDPVAPAKILVQFAKDNDKLEIKAGIMNGRFLDLNEIKELSALPSREILIAQILSAINGVPTGFVRALNNIPQKFLNLLQAVKDQKEAA